MNDCSCDPLYIKFELKERMPSYTPTHYFLLLVTGVLFTSLFIGVLFLLYRERWKGKQAQKAYWLEVLRRRRQGISGKGRDPVMLADPTNGDNPGKAMSTSDSYRHHSIVENLEIDIPRQKS